MKNYLRCKACGYIMEEGDYDVCPACGVPKAALEPYKMSLSEKRHKILDLHIHPILVHFPQAFTLFGLVLLIALVFIRGALGDALLATARVVVTLLPAAVIAGFLSGIMDGRTRFKKLKAPLLKKKIALGCAFTFCSIVSAVFIHFTAPSDFTWFIEVVFLLICTVLSSFLGKIGGSLTEAKLPG